jgi:hypothetical protein
LQVTRRHIDTESIELKWWPFVDKFRHKDIAETEGEAEQVSLFHEINHEKVNSKATRTISGKVQLLFVP